MNIKLKKLSSIENEKTGHRHTIGVDRWLLYVVQLLKFFGNCPLTICGGRHCFKWLKWSTLWSLFAASWFTFAWIITIVYIALKVRAPFNLSLRFANDVLDKGFIDDSSLTPNKLQALLQTMTIIYSLVSMFQLLSILWGWYSIGDLATYLNNWDSIQEQYLATFSIQSNDEEDRCHEKWSRRFRLKLAIYTAFPVLVVCPTFLSGFKTSSSSLPTAFLYLQIFIHFIFVESLEDAKNILIFMGLADAFYQIRKNILSSIRWQTLSEEKVQSWRRIIGAVRSQNELASKYIQPSQLSFIFCLVLMGTLLFYLSLNCPWTSDMGFRVAILAMGIFILMLRRMYVKVVMAEEITKEEAAIGNDLVMMDVAKLDLPVLAQIKITHDFIRQNPTEVKLGNYVTMNKKLFIGIFSQVITYIIVLMQFFQSM